LRFRFSPKIWTAATFDFCNTIPSVADIIRTFGHVREVPIVLQKSEKAQQLISRQRTKQATIADQ
jgi:hypothetical protein